MPVVVDLVGEVPLVGLVAGAVWYVRHQRRQYRAVASPPAMTSGQVVAELAAGAPRVRCVLTGTAAAGPAGPLLSALDATPCVWHRYEVWEHWMRHGPRHRHRWRQWAEGETSTELFAVGDGTGQVLVDPGHAHLDGLRPAVDRMITPDWTVPVGMRQNGITGYQEISWLIRPGDPLTVIGAVVLRDGAAVVEGAEAFPPIVTTGTRKAFLRGTRVRLLAGTALGALAAVGAALLAAWVAG